MRILFNVIVLSKANPVINLVNQTAKNILE